MKLDGVLYYCMTTCIKKKGNIAQIKSHSRAFVTNLLHFIKGACSYHPKTGWTLPSRTFWSPQQVFSPCLVVCGLGYRSRHGAPHLPWWALQQEQPRREGSGLYMASNSLDSRKISRDSLVIWQRKTAPACQSVCTDKNV